MIKIGLAKGRLSEGAIDLFKKLNMADDVNLKSRKLVFEDLKHQVTYLLLKPKDVVTYVESGVVDLGVVGSDVILESKKSVYQLCDLDFGKCKFSIASVGGNMAVLNQKNLKVATKYPNITGDYFKKRNQKIQIIPLEGSVELAPLMGFSDCIVDIVETGKTLKANNLKIIEDMFLVSAKLISNKVSYRFNQERINQIVASIKEVL
jgi:ATP phosphoribosyltransferase